MTLPVHYHMDYLTHSNMSYELLHSFSIVYLQNMIAFSLKLFPYLSLRIILNTESEFTIIVHASSSILTLTYLYYPHLSSYIKILK